MDPAVVATIYGAFRKALHDPRHLEVLKKFDMEMFEMGPAAYQKWSLEEIDRQQQIIAKFGEKTEQK